MKTVKCGQIFLLSCGQLRKKGELNFFGQFKNLCDVPGAVILKIYYMANGLAAIIHNKIPPNFQGNWEKMKKSSHKNFAKKFLIRTEQIEKRLLPGSGETDCNELPYKYMLALRTTESDEATSCQPFVQPDPWLM